MNDEKPTAPSILPKLKHGLTISFNQYDKSGKPQWIIHDPGRNKFFIIGWLEHEIITHWELENPELIISAINENTTLHVELQDIENFLEFLKRNYLLQQSGYQISNTAKEQHLFKNDNIIHWLTSHYLFFKIPLCKPDNFLTKTQYIAKWIFSRYTAYVMTILAIIGFYQILMHWDSFIHSYPNLISWEGLFFAFIAFSITKLIHELGHAYMCKRYGVPVPTLGIAFLVFWPVLYTDTTMSWQLESRQRLRISFAGIWMETYVVIIAALLWNIIDNFTVQTICFITITVNWIASLLINTSPFMRFDGYFILSDYLQMPNLQPRAFALTRWQLRQWLFGWDEAVPEKFSSKIHWFLVGYSLATWLYRLVLYLGIAILVYNYFFKLLGIILFLIEIYYFILAPVVFEIKLWTTSKNKFSWNKQTIRTAIILALFFLTLVLPVRHTISIPATMSYKHQFLYAPASGILASSLPSPNTKFKKDEMIMQIKSPELIHSLQIIALEYQKTLSQIRLTSINHQFVSEKNNLLSNLNEQRAEYKKLHDEIEKLNIKAPFNGVLVEVSSDLHPGEIIAKDEWLGDFISNDFIQVEAFVSQIDLKKIHTDSSGHFYAEDTSLPPIPVKITVIEALNVSQLECRYTRKNKKSEEEVAIETPCYHASELGGAIPIYFSEKGEFIPERSIYRVILSNTEPVNLSYLLRGTVKISTPYSSYASELFYWLKKLIIQEADT